ncbi:hypothetical protein MN608_10942 [Microdochium nivale]|nr:hypothetical protein MN608_10942 [Microdochium nivale]
MSSSYIAWLCGCDETYYAAAACLTTLTESQGGVADPITSLNNNASVAYSSKAPATSENVLLYKKGRIGRWKIVIVLVPLNQQTLLRDIPELASLHITLLLRIGTCLPASKLVKLEYGDVIIDTSDLRHWDAAPPSVYHLTREHGTAPIMDALYRGKSICNETSPADIRLDGVVITDAMVEERNIKGFTASFRNSQSQAQHRIPRGVDPGGRLRYVEQQGSLFGIRWTTLFRQDAVRLADDWHCSDFNGLQIAICGIKSPSDQVFPAGAAIFLAKTIVDALPANIIQQEEHDYWRRKPGQSDSDVTTTGRALGEFSEINRIDTGITAIQQSSPPPSQTLRNRLANHSRTAQLHIAPTAPKAILYMGSPVAESNGLPRGILNHKTMEYSNDANISKAPRDTYMTSFPIIPSELPAVGRCRNNFRCGWELPAVYRFRLAQRNSSPATINQVVDFLGTFVALTGDEEGFQCCTVAQFLEERWKSAGSTPLQILAESLMVALGLETELSKSPAHNVASVDNFSVDDELIVYFSGDLSGASNLVKAITWVCSAIRLPPGSTLTSASASGVFKSTSYSLLEKTGKINHFVGQLKPLEVWDPAATAVGSTCWTKLFSSGVIAWKHLGRDWGLGLELAFNMMVHLSATENFCQHDSGVVLLGYQSALVPVQVDEANGSIQWHYETCEDGFISPDELCATKQDWVKFSDTSEIQKARCFVGWFEQAHIFLGTHEMLEPNFAMAWSSTEECRQTLHSKGVEAGAQMAFSLGPINIAPQAIKTWGFVSNVQRYSPTQQYRQTLRQSRTRTALVIDSQTKQAWLVPMLSLLLHMCHIYHQRIMAHTANTTNLIPYAAPASDGAQAVLDAIELAGDLVVLGQAGEPDTENLRQLFLRMHTSLVQAASLREKPTIKHIFATELMATIDPPFFGSGLRKVDVNAINSSVESWKEFAHHVDVVGVCANLGQAIRPVVTTPDLCVDCSTLPTERFYLAAHMQCLENLTMVAGGTLDDLSSGGCQLGFKTYWSAHNKLWARCLSSSHTPFWDARPSPQVLQQLSSHRLKKTKSAIFKVAVSKDGVVVFGNDSDSLRPRVAALYQKARDSYRSP